MGYSDNRVATRLLGWRVGMSRPQRSIFLLGAAAIALSSALVSGCSSGDGANGQSAGPPQGTEFSGSRCPDASGANSTASQIREAALSAEYTNPVTGQRHPVADDFDAEGVQNLAPVFVDVADGGDAAFSAAVCELPEWGDNTLDGSYISLGLTPGLAPPGHFSEIPHLLRGLGRGACTSREVQSKSVWDQSQANLVRQIDAGRKDPESVKAPIMAGLAAASSPEYNRINTIPAEDFVVNLVLNYQTRELALQYVCPQFSQ